MSKIVAVVKLYQISINLYLKTDLNISLLQGDHLNALGPLP